MADGSRTARRPGLFYRLMMSFIGLFDRWLHLSCRSFVRLASEKHERPLTLGERIRQAVHRAMCRVCRVHEDKMDRLVEISRRIGNSSVDEVDEELSKEALERIRQAVSDAAGKHRG